MAELRGKTELDYYKVLQVDSSAEPEVIEASYRALSKKYHPDRNLSPDAAARMSQINAAFNVLRDASRRRDYDQLRQQTKNTATAPAAPRPNPGPAPSGSTTANPSSRPASSNSSSNNVNSSRPASNSNGYNTSNPSNHRATASGSETSAPPPSPKSASKERPAPNLYSEPAKKPGILRWLLILGVLLVAVVGGFFLAETFLDNPLKTHLVANQPPANQPVATPTLPKLTPAVAFSTTAPAATPIGPVSRELVFAYLNNPELYEGRLSEVLLVDNVLQLKVRLSKNGRIVNGLDSPLLGSANDELDALRQSELTAYTLTYSLFGRFNDLKTINLSLSDAADDRKIVYRAQIPRAQAYSFSSWRGTLDAKTLSQQDYVRAAREDRIILHLGGPTEDIVRSRVNQPDKNNLRDELASWDLNPGTLDVLMDSNGVQIGYYAVRPDEEKLADYAKIFYALYTRFPGLDRIQVQDNVPGTAAKYSRASNRALFNLIGPTDWAQAAFDSRGRELLDRLPTTLNSPQLANPAQGVTEVLVNPNVNTLVKNWQIVNPGTSSRFSQISTFNTIKGQFVLVKVPLKNLSREAQWPFPNAYFSLADAQGRFYQPDPIATLFYIMDVEKRTPSGPVDPGKDLEMKLVFDIPLNASGLRLLFQDKDTRASLPITAQ